MNFKTTPELHAFLSTFANTDPETDEATTQAFAASCAPDRARKIQDQAKQLLVAPNFPLEEIGLEANRWFGDAEEGRAWLKNLLPLFKSGEVSESVVVKDSNGAVLSEGDSVQVIKDLKVKGGSSDLKRGTTIKKIHLIGDPEAIECRVEGSVLVLKTCFLKKV